MGKVRRWFEHNYENCDIVEYDGNLEAKTNIVRYLVVSPHSGTDNQWMLRVTTISAFDRWSNSTAVEEFFETEIELYLYLYNHQLDIYKNLLEYLSLEYEEVTK